MGVRTRRAALVVSLTFLLVAAGCSGGANTTSTTSTTSTATTTSTPPTTSTWSENVTREHYPPGVAANGTLMNVNALLDAHFNSTADESMMLIVTGTNPDGRLVRRYAHGANGVPIYSSVNQTEDVGNVCGSSTERSHTHTSAPSPPGRQDMSWRRT